MARTIRLDYRARPSLAAFLGRALQPSPGLARGGVPAITARWQHRVEAAELARFHALCGLPQGEALPLLYPHTAGFALHMSILTQPQFPLPIWRMLQIRNRIVQHAPLAQEAPLDIAVSIAGHRILDKGAEFDLRCEVIQRDALAWESLTTFYSRGRFGAPSAQANAPAAPRVEGAQRLLWRSPEGGGWRFGGLSGDYNPLHWWGGYARWRGYRRAFHHPQRVLGECLARLPQPGALPQRLDAWIKGPVFYGAPLELRQEEAADGLRFALHVDGDARPAIVGCLGRP